VKKWDLSVSEVGDADIDPFTIPSAIGDIYQ